MSDLSARIAEYQQAARDYEEAKQKVRQLRQETAQAETRAHELYGQVDKALGGVLELIGQPPSEF